MTRGSSARRLDDRDARFAPERVAPGQLDDEIEALVDDLRKRMRRIEPDRRQQRLDLALEVIGHPARAARIEVAAPQPGGCPPARAPGSDRLVQHAGIARRPEACASSLTAAEQRTQPGQRHARRRQLRRAAAASSPATRISKNSSRLLPTMHRKREPLGARGTTGVLGEREHAAVERELRQLAVDGEGRG